MSKRVILVLATVERNPDEVWEALRKLEYEVHVLHDLEACLEAMNRLHVDMALLDACENLRDALEILQVLRGLREDLPVVLWGEDFSSENMIAAAEGGASAFVSHPIRFEDILEYIRRLLEGGR